MSDLTDWIQSYWYELLSLTAQFAILAVAVWFGRRALTLLAPSQRHTALSAKPSEAASVFVPGEPEARTTQYSDARRVQPEVSAESIASSEVPARPAPKRTNPWRYTVDWLRAPMYKATNTRALKQPAAPAAFVQTDMHIESVPPDPQPQPAHAGAGRMFAAPVKRESYAAARAWAESMPSGQSQRDSHSAGHAGVGRMLSPLPEQPEEQEEVVSYRLVKRTSLWQGVLNWMRTPINGRATSAWQRVTIRH